MPTDTELRAIAERLHNCAECTDHPSDAETMWDAEKAIIALLDRIATLEADRARIVELSSYLSTAADWFSDYERQHRFKRTAEADLKADVNADRAAWLRAALADQPTWKGDPGCP